MDLSGGRFFVVVAAFLTCFVPVSGASDLAPICGEAGVTVVVEVSRRSLKGQFRCGASFSELNPSPKSGNVYGSHGCISPVKLSDCLPGAHLARSSTIHNLYTISVPALPTEKSQLLYYLCLSPDRKRACKVVVNVPPAAKLEGSNDEHAISLKAAFPTCSGLGTTVVSYMSSASRRAYFMCSFELSNLDPPIESGTVYTDGASFLAVPLTSLAPGVLVKLSPGNSLYVLTLLQLPESGFRYYFYRCVSPVSTRQACTVKIVVPPRQQSTSIAEAGERLARPQQRRSVQRVHWEEDYGNSARRCSVYKKAIIIPLSPHSLSAQFTCASDISLLDPPVLSGNIYVDKSCSHTVSLGSLWNGSLHMSSGFSPSYTLRMKELPHNGPRALFYRCKNPQKDQACLVEVRLPDAIETAPRKALEKTAANTPICSKPGGSIEVNIDVKTKFAKFSCGSSFSVLQPSIISGKAYITRSCKVSTLVREHVGGGISLSETDKNWYTVSLHELPKEESKRFYLLCAEPSSRSTCKVMINVPQALGVRARNVHANKKVHVCHAGPEAAIRVTLQAYEDIRIKCAPGLALQPQSLEEVFDNTDGTCSGLSMLRSLLPGAQLLLASSETRRAALAQSFDFGVRESPHEDRELCYHCAPNAHMKVNDCKILISVRGKGSSHKIGSRYGGVVAPRSGGGPPSARVKGVIYFAAFITLAQAVNVSVV